VPPALDQIVQGCLAKDPDERWQSTADVKRQLRWIASTSSSSGATPAALPSTLRRRRSLWWFSTAALATALAIVLPAALRQWWTPDANVVRFSIVPPVNTTFAADIAQVPSTQLAVSPDGRSVAFVAASPGKRSGLWVREFAATEPRLLAGTDDASYPFWSADGGSLGFFAQGKLRRVDSAGGSLLELCEAGPDPRGGTWNRDGLIVFARDMASGLSQVSAGGGAPEPLLDLRAGENSYRWPSFLPDGRRFLFHVRVINGRGLHLGSIGSRSTTLVKDQHDRYLAAGRLPQFPGAVYRQSRPGHAAHLVARRRPHHVSIGPGRRQLSVREAVGPQCAGTPGVDRRNRVLDRLVD